MFHVEGTLGQDLGRSRPCRRSARLQAQAEVNVLLLELCPFRLGISDLELLDTVSCATLDSDFGGGCGRHASSFA